MNENRDTTDFVLEKLKIALTWYKQNSTLANRVVIVSVCALIIKTFVPFQSGDITASQMAINPQPITTGSVVDPIETSQGRLQHTTNAEAKVAAQYQATLNEQFGNFLSYRAHQFATHTQNIQRDNNLPESKQALQIAQSEQTSKLIELARKCEDKKGETKRKCQSTTDAEVGKALVELLALQMLSDKGINLGDIRLKDQSDVVFNPTNLATDNNRLREATADRVAATESYQDALVARTSK